MATKRKRRSNNPAGRPSRGLSEVRVLVPMPALLKAMAEEAAAAEGVGLSEYVRRALGVRIRTPPG